MVKPNDVQKANAYYSHSGHFEYKESTSIFSIFTEPLRHTIKGHTMGTISYTIHYYDEKDRNFKPQIDSLLVRFNQTFSTYIPDSKISQFNSSGSIKANEWIIDLHERASKIQKELKLSKLPTILLFQQHELVDRIEGIVAKTVLQEKLQHLIDQQNSK